MAVREIKSKAKKEVLQFIKTNMEAEYTFTIVGDEYKATKYLQRMRTELSRLRDLVRERGKVPKHFKMIHVSTVHDPKAGNCVIVLKKTTSANDVSELVQEAFADLEAGDKIDG